MDSFIKVGRTSEFADGTLKEVAVEGREILLARVEDSYYAVNNRCPHMGARLSQGKLEDTVVTCPRHGSRYDLKNGSVVRWLQGSGIASAVGAALRSSRPLDTYRVRVSNGNLEVDIESTANNS